MRNAKAIMTLIVTSLILAACNTVEGVGRDIKSAGEAIEDAAD
jgi:predicted small secreted protein